MLDTNIRPSGLTGASQHTLTLIAMCFAVLMVQLDTTVVNLALHDIQRQLQTPVATLQWVIDAYNVAYATFILTGGVLGDLWGRRRVFLIGAGIFTVAMLMCGLSSSAAGVIGWRAIAGVGAAFALPGSLSILRVTYTDAQERTRAVSIWAGINGVAIAIGPSVGGILIQGFGWRSVFWGVVPIGVVAWLLAWSAVRESSDPEGRHMDVPSQALTIVCLALLTLACIQGSAWGWRSPAILAAFAIAAAALAVWVVWERRTHDPLVPLDIFRQRSFSASLAIATCMTFGMYALLFVFPLYLQTVRHHAPLRAGLELLPMGLTFALISPFAGRIANSIGPRMLIAIGMVLGGIGILSVSLASATTSMALLLVAMGVVGIALGLETGPLMAVAVASLPASRSGLASGLVNVARMVGATLGVAILGAVFASHAGPATTTAAAIPQFLTGMQRALVGGAVAEMIGGAVAWWFIEPEALQARNGNRAPN